MSEVMIQVRENGPYKVTGPAIVVDADGNEFELPGGAAFVLCRCGHSSNKPFCDATHKQIEWIAEETAPRRQME